MNLNIDWNSFISCLNNYVFVVTLKYYFIIKYLIMLLRRIDIILHQDERTYLKKCKIF